jgi:hypothetical protein
MRAFQSTYNAAILPLHHVHDRCFSCGGARLRTLEAGFDNQSRGNSERLARFSSLAEATGSEKSPRLGRWVPRSACTLQIHRVRNPGNRLPGFGSLS